MPNVLQKGKSPDNHHGTTTIVEKSNTLETVRGLYSDIDETFVYT